MATLRTIKNRIRATKNIGQITKAMQAVSAVKMRRSEQAAIKSRPYALASLEILKNVREALLDSDTTSMVLDGNPEASKNCLVVVTSDKGLAGSFNSNVLRRSLVLIREASKPYDIVAIGKRGRDFLSRRGNVVIEEFLKTGDYVSIDETFPIAQYVYNLYLTGQYEEISLVYTNFLSALKQQVVIRKILPVNIEALEKITRDIIPQTGMYAGMPQAIDRALNHSDTKFNFKFEPSLEEVLNELLPRLVGIELHQSILEANASEHSSRMVAMKSASDNAGELVDTLGVTYNKLRQGAITKELTEISAGTEALSQN